MTERFRWKDGSLQLPLGLFVCEMSLQAAGLRQSTKRHNVLRILSLYCLFSRYTPDLMCRKRIKVLLLRELATVDTLSKRKEGESMFY